MFKYEKMLQVLPPLLEKLWPGKYSFSNFYHVKSGTFQINVIPSGYYQDFVFLNAEGKTLDEATENLYKAFNKKCGEHWNFSVAEKLKAEKSMNTVEAILHSIPEDIKKCIDKETNEH